MKTSLEYHLCQRWHTLDQRFVELTSQFSFTIERLESLAAILALAMVLAWGSGINLYATTFAVGIMAATGQTNLPNGLMLLENQIVIAVSAVMYLTEFCIARSIKDDTGWDAVHTFIYIPAGGALAAGAVAGSGLIAVIGIGVAGAFFSHQTHNSILGAKHYLFRSAGLFSPASASILKDVILLAGLWTSFHFPMILLTLLVCFFIYILT